MKIPIYKNNCCLQIVGYKDYNEFDKDFKFEYKLDLFDVCYLKGGVIWYKNLMGMLFKTNLKL